MLASHLSRFVLVCVCHRREAGAIHGSDRRNVSGAHAPKTDHAVTKLVHTVHLNQGVRLFRGVRFGTNSGNPCRGQTGGVRAEGLAYERGPRTELGYPLHSSRLQHQRRGTRTVNFFEVAQLPAPS